MKYRRGELAFRLNEGTWVDLTPKIGGKLHPDRDYLPCVLAYNPDRPVIVAVSRKRERSDDLAVAEPGAKRDPRWDDRRDADCVVAAEGKDFAVHRRVIAAHSPVLETALDGEVRTEARVSKIGAEVSKAKLYQFSRVSDASMWRIIQVYGFPGLT